MRVLYVSPMADMPQWWQSRQAEQVFGRKPAISRLNPASLTPRQVVERFRNSGVDEMAVAGLPAEFFEELVLACRRCGLSPPWQLVLRVAEPDEAAELFFDGGQRVVFGGWHRRELPPLVVVARPVVLSANAVPAAEAA